MTSKITETKANNFMEKLINLKIRRSLEIAAFIRQTFEPIIFTSQFPKTQISIYLQIFQNDGGLLT